MRIESNQPTKRNNARLMLTTAPGAALGAGIRYILPTQAEMKTLKQSADTFFSNAATAARGSKRSILKYAGIGAIVAGGVHLLTKLFAKKQDKAQTGDVVEFSKYQSL